MPQPIILDKTGFPMVWVEAIDAYMHWLPVTKIQFERFICDRPSTRFDWSWYEEVTENNPRIPPQKITIDNYWQAFMTALQPSEVRIFSEFCGAEYEIPTIEQWDRAFSEARSTDPMEWLSFDELDLTHRARTVLERMRDLANTDLKGEPSQAKQMLMIWGVMEWVSVNKGEVAWAGKGLPNKSFHSRMGTPREPHVKEMLQPDARRMKDFGCRLIRRV